MIVHGRKEKTCLRKVTELHKGTVCKEVGMEKGEVEERR